jgi:leucyl-tRNA synthetase
LPLDATAFRPCWDERPFLCLFAPMEPKEMAEVTTTKRQFVERYDAAPVEKKWQARWEETSLYKVDDNDPRPKWYSLAMYPYPSGILHVGHWYAEAIPDSFARYKRMQGFNVLFPMGYDAFGLPAENAAIRNNIHPATWTYDNMAHMTQQFKTMGTMIDWSRELATCDPSYYHWNQWIFLKML